MGETVEFRVDGTTAGGYLAVPDSGSGPGVLVLQEWWGLVPQIMRTCDRLAAEGFVVFDGEWWHFEHGTRRWAAITGHPPRYGPASDQTT